MKIQANELTNFRCFEELAVSFEQPITFLVGGNAVGKSTILDALRFAALGVCRGTAAGGGGAEVLARLGTQAASSRVTVTLDGAVISRGLSDGPRSAVQRQVAEKLGVGGDVALVCLAWDAFLHMDPGVARRALMDALDVRITAAAVKAEVGEAAMQEIAHLQFGAPETLAVAYTYAYALRRETNAALKAAVPPDLSAYPEAIQAMTADEAAAYLPKSKEQLEALESQLSEAEGATARREGESDEKRRHLHQCVVQTQNELGKAQRYFQALPKAKNIATLTKKLEKAVKEHETATEGLLEARRMIAAHQTDLAAHRRRLAALDAMITPGAETVIAAACPTCDQPVSREIFHRLMVETKSAIASVEDILRQRESAQAQAQEHVRRFEAAAGIVQEEIAAAEKADDDRKRVTGILHALGEELAGHQREMAALPALSVHQGSLLGTPDPASQELAALRGRVEKGRKVNALLETYIPTRKRWEDAQRDAREGKALAARLDAIVTALAPKGPVAAKCIQGKIDAFIQVFNNALKPFGYRGWVDLEHFDVKVMRLDAQIKDWLPMRMLSESEGLRLGLAIQTAFAMQSGFGVIVADGTSLLDSAGSASLMDMVWKAQASGVEQFIFTATIRGPLDQWKAPEIAGCEFILLEG